MELNVHGTTVLAKSRHIINGDAMTAILSVLCCEGADSRDAYIYEVALLDSEGDVVLAEPEARLAQAKEVFETLKAILGPSFN